MARSSSKYICQQCGYEAPQWYGRCPNCQEWGSLVESIIQEQKTKNIKHKEDRVTEIVKLAGVKEEGLQRISSGIKELDYVLGGGFVLGQVVLLAGEPGIGKSTLLSQVAETMYAKSKQKHVLYVAGEESTNQIRIRTTRLGLAGERVFILEETDVDSVTSQIRQVSQIGLIIVDSIQTLSTDDLVGMTGSVGQVRESASRLISIAKQHNIPLILVGHVTKEGTIAGPRVLEHMVDTVLWFEGDRSQPLRLLRVIKNRFGPTDEVGIFTMEEKGLVAVNDPASHFVSNVKNIPGQIATILLEGTRPILVEIQALVVPSKLAIPRRVVQGVDVRRVELLLAVLTRRVGASLYNYDVFVNVAGGIQVGEPAADLAIALAIVSAWANKALPSCTAALGEVGLLGDIRNVAQFTRRAKEAKRLGVKNLISHETNTMLVDVIRELRLRTSK